MSDHVPVEIPALLICLTEVRRDRALIERGGRRVAVTELRPDSEIAISKVTWEAPTGGRKCEVLSGDSFEFSTFNQHAKQQRHFHKIGTEIYMVLEGKMKIEVQGEIYELVAGDSIIIRPGASHEILPAEDSFLCRTLCFNCQGVPDKYLD